MSLLSSLELALADGLGLPAAAGTPALGVFLAYAATALLCALASQRPRPRAQARSSTASARRARPEGLGADAGHMLWPLAVAAVLLLGLDSLLHGDRLFVLWVREVAAQQGWYEHRRVLQIAVLAAGGALAVAAAPRGLNRLRGAALAPASAWLLTGLCGLVLLHALRLVSLHYTDLLLDLHLAGGSVGRWIELLALASAAGAALMRLRSPARPSLREFPHV